MSDAENQEDLNITLGVEEEFFLVDPESRDLLADPDPRIFEACEAGIGPHKVTREALRPQIETNTRVCESVAEAREALRETRGIVIEAAGAYGAAVLGSSTHPFAAWREQTITPRERYTRFQVTFQEAMRRMVVGGMHIHAGFGDPESRIRVMTAIRRYLPAIHALSTSSPFNSGRDTGYKSYRLNLIGNLPRTNLPPPLRTRTEYEEIVSEYQRMKFIENGSEIWWDVRPAHAYPTLELRICDICPWMEDAIAIAALYTSLLRWLIRQDKEGALPPEPLTEIIAENRWVAHRYGTLAFFGDSSKRAGGWMSMTSCTNSSRNSRPTPGSLGARWSCATRSPSSARAAARIGRQTSTASGASRATRTRRPSAKWWTWCSPKPKRASSECRAKISTLGNDRPDFKG